MQQSVNAKYKMVAALKSAPVPLLKEFRKRLKVLQVLLLAQVEATLSEIPGRYRGGHHFTSPFQPFRYDRQQ